jgi:hypothetical protein
LHEGATVAHVFHVAGDFIEGFHLESPCSR